MDTSNIISGISNVSFTFSSDSTVMDKAEAKQLYLEAETYVLVNTAGKIDHEPEDTSEDWKIMPMCMIDPTLQEEWKKARLWMTDPFDGALGDDAMPALCSSCNGVFWGDQMKSIVKTVHSLRIKHRGTINSMLGNVWEETEPQIIKKLRANRMCKKCCTISIDARTNPWRTEYYGNTTQIPVQQNLPFGQISSSAPLIPYNMAPPPGGWNITYTDGNNDTVDAVSKTFIKPNDNDI